MHGKHGGRFDLFFKDASQVFKGSPHWKDSGKRVRNESNRRRGGVMRPQAGACNGMRSLQHRPFTPPIESRKRSLWPSLGPRARELRKGVERQLPWSRRRNQGGGFVSFFVCLLACAQGLDPCVSFLLLQDVQLCLLFYLLFWLLRRAEGGRAYQ